MNYWWANQGNNFSVAIEQRTLWTCPRADGRRTPDRECIKDMQTDDIVFHYAQGEIRAVSRVTQDWRPARRPAVGYETDRDDHDEGWLVRVEPIADDLHVPLSEVAEVVEHGRRYGPLNARGGVNVKYLFELTPTEGERLLELTGVAEASADRGIEDEAPPGARVAFESDPERRKAIEVHAENVAIALLRRDGYTDIERRGKPFDLLAYRGDEVLHVEVKGSSIDVDTVILTRNEVAHASEHTTTLFVIDRIEVRTSADGKYECRNGRPRRWDAWVPAPEDLTPLQHAYVLPSRQR